MAQPPMITSTAAPQSTIFISNMLPNVGTQTLRSRMTTYGDLKSVNIIYNAEGVSKGMAVVEFYKQIDAIQAINEMNDKYFFGQVVNVKLINKNTVELANQAPINSSSLNPTSVSSQINNINHHNNPNNNKINNNHNTNNNINNINNNINNTNNNITNTINRNNHHSNENIKLPSTPTNDFIINPAFINNNNATNRNNHHSNESIKLPSTPTNEFIINPAFINNNTINRNNHHSNESIKLPSTPTNEFIINPNETTILLDSFQDNESRTAIIENLSPTVTASVLINHLQNIGNIISCGFYDIVSLRKRKTAYITFASVVECLNFIANFHKQFFIDEAIIVSLQPDCEILKFLSDKFNLKGSDDITVEFIGRLALSQVEEENVSSLPDINNLHQDTVSFRVSNISPNATDAQLHEHFLYTGQILNIQPVTNSDDNDQVMITFKNSNSMPFLERLMNNTRFNGKLLRVEMLH